MLSLKNVTKSFLQGSENFFLFKESSYDFAPGNSYAIMGTSGSGKSTLLHMLIGIETPTSGEIFFEGKSSRFLLEDDKNRHRKSLGIMFQQPYLLSELTVLENVMLQVILHGVVTEQDKKRAYQLLKEVNLEKKHAMSPFLLSGGEQQRVALLRALFYPPKWLLVDEPTGSLDEDSGKDIILLLRKYQDQYTMGIVMSTHDKKVGQSMNEVLYIRNKKLEKI